MSKGATLIRLITHATIKVMAASNKCFYVLPPVIFVYVYLKWMQSHIEDRSTSYSLKSMRLTNDVLTVATSSGSLVNLDVVDYYNWTDLNLTAPQMMMQARPRFLNHVRNPCFKVDMRNDT